MAIMERVRDVTGAEAFGTDASGGSDDIACSDCGRSGGRGSAPITWGFSRSEGRERHTCPECIRATLGEIETFVSL